MMRGINDGSFTALANATSPGFGVGMAMAVTKIETTGRGGDTQRRIVEVDFRVREALHALAARYAAQGLQLFLFGSAAVHWPAAPVGADFDLGYQVPEATPDREALRRKLHQEVAELPTIRPIDLVDFSSVSEPFRREAMKRIINLAHERPVTTAG